MRRVIVKIFHVILPKLKSSNFINPVDLKNIIARTITIEHLKEAQSIEITSEKVKQLEDQFISGEYYDWIHTEQAMYQTLEKFYTLTQNDIEQMLEEYKKTTGSRTSKLTRSSFGGTRGSLHSRSGSLGGSIGSLTWGSTARYDETAEFDSDDLKRIMINTFSSFDLEKEKLCYTINFELIFAFFDLNKSRKIDFK